MRKMNFAASQLIQVAVVGVGGTGSEVLSGLLQIHLSLKALGRAGLMVYAFDPDTVSEANLVRQRYHPSDLGANKAVTLIRRINAASGTNWQAFPKRFAGDATRENWDIVISCVDTRSARAALHAAAFSSGFHYWKWWMDYGNETDFGQVLIGQPRNAHNDSKVRLKVATEIHPQLIDMAQPDDDAPSCSAFDALQKQDLMINKVLCNLGLAVLWNGLHTGMLKYHGYYVNLDSGISQARALPEDLEHQDAPLTPVKKKPARPKSAAPAAARL